MPRYQMKEGHNKLVLAVGLPPGTTKTGGSNEI
jgi:hypothetical protein